jgi:hypothetical protein
LDIAPNISILTPSSPVTAPSFCPTHAVTYMGHCGWNMLAMRMVARRLGRSLATAVWAVMCWNGAVVMAGALQCRFQHGAVGGGQAQLHGATCELKRCGEQPPIVCRHTELCTIINIRCRGFLGAQPPPISLTLCMSWITRVLHLGSQASPLQSKCRTLFNLKDSLCCIQRVRLSTFDATHRVG